MRRYPTAEELVTDLSATDEVWRHHRHTIQSLRYLGYLVLTRTNTGTFECHWWSASCFYSLLAFLLHLYFLYVAASERQIYMSTKINRTFDEDLFLYSLYVFFLYELIPLTLILESKKIARYYNAFAVFQARYYFVKGERLNLGLKRDYEFKTLAFIAASFMVLFIANIFNIRSVYKELTREVVQPFVENLICVAFLIADVVVFFWICIVHLKVLHGAADQLVRDIQKGDPEEMDDFGKLWLDLAHQVQYLGEAFTYSFGYFLMVSIFASTFELYLAIKEEHAVVTVYGASLVLSNLIVFFSVDLLIHKLTDGLKGELLNGSSGRRDISQFFRWMRRFDGRVTLGGFVSVNNRLAPSVINNIATYIVILLQFKQSNGA